MTERGKQVNGWCCQLSRLLASISSGREAGMTAEERSTGDETAHFRIQATIATFGLLPAAKKRS